jgi:DNA polymerase-1
VRDPADLQSVVWALDETDVVGLDLETTGLDPLTDRIRLLSLATDRGAYLVDCFAVDPRPLFDLLVGKTVIGHNLQFDLSFLAGLGFVPGKVRDTMLLSQLLHAGRRYGHKLGDCAERELGKKLDKELQTSDWSAGELSAEQLDYATADVEVLRPLCKALDAKLAAAGLERAAAVEMGCLPALVWLSRSGVAFNRDAWEAMARQAGGEANALALQLDGAASPVPGELAGMSGRNWDSPAQVKGALAVVGCEVDSTDDDALAAVDHPLAELIRQYRGASKRVSTYGLDWLKHVRPDGRVYAHWLQLGAGASGRMSCARPNLQQIPQGGYRRSFVAPPGRALVKADYSQIELRIAAKIAGDRAMLDAYARGEDLHTLTARRLLGKEQVSKEDRRIAKSANFGLLYGMGVNGYRRYAKSRYGLTLADAAVRGYRNAFFAAYPGLAAWHRKAGGTGKRAVETRTLAGRRRLDVSRFTEKLNTPVQGTGADGLKQALALLWERRADVPGAFPVLVVHDEIVVECGQDQSSAVADWLKAAMVEAMAPLIEPVPVEVEVKIARAWGGG